MREGEKRMQMPEEEEEGGAGVSSLRRHCAACHSPEVQGYHALGDGSSNQRYYCQEHRDRVGELCLAANMLSMARHAGDARLIDKYATAWGEGILVPGLFPHPDELKRPVAAAAAAK